MFRFDIDRGSSLREICVFANREFMHAKKNRNEIKVNSDSDNIYFHRSSIL